MAQTHLRIVAGLLLATGVNGVLDGRRAGWAGWACTQDADTRDDASGDGDSTEWASTEDDSGLSEESEAATDHEGAPTKAADGSVAESAESDSAHAQVQAAPPVLSRADRAREVRIQHAREIVLG